MKPKMFENGVESPKTISVAPPVIESFLNSAEASSAWPEYVAHNQEFIKQTEAHQKLNERLDTIIVNLPRPDLTFPEATAQNFITEKQTADLYNSLSDLLEEGRDYERLLLYLPFEFLPNATWQPTTKELRDAVKRFKTAYLTAWHNLLEVQDVRANFVDGDVLETESRTADLPRVVKVAHLIPKLVENGLLKTKDVLKLMETSEDETLKHSLADTLPVLNDLGLISEDELKYMKASDDLLIRDAATYIISEVNKIDKNNIVANQPKEMSLLSLQNKLSDELERVNAEKYDDISKKRGVWLRQEKKQKAIETVSGDINVAITNKTIDDNMMAQIAAPETSIAMRQAFIDGVRQAVESTALINFPEAQSLYNKYHDLLLALWKNNESQVRQMLAKTFYRLHGLGLVKGEQLSDLELAIPNLTGPFSENLNSMKEEMRDIQDIVALIEKDHELSQYLYPVVLIFGSRLKGYGEKDADIDVGVFVKPGVSESDLEKIQQLLKNTFAHEKIHGEVIEFWLEENKSGLDVRDFKKSNSSLGDSSWTHVLFGAAWEGDENAIKELRQKLLVPYLYETKKIIHGREARGLYLEELERDTIQYRLMHKGYEKYFPSFGGLNAPHADRIDGQSTFWDSGFRQTATKLFASRVFLPKISHS